MAKQFFSDLPDTTTPLRASRLNELLDGDEALGQIIVDSVRSKNMFNINSWFKINNATASISGNTLTQTNTTGYARSEWLINNLIVGKTYKFSCNYTNSSSCSLRLNIFDNTNTSSIAQSSVVTNTSGSLSVTFTAATTSHYLRIYSNSTGTANTNTVTFTNIQLEIGSSVTTYMPYQNLDNKDNYSTEEQAIGTWIDGKPIYRKVIQTTLTTTNEWVYTTVSNIKECINMFGYATSTSSSSNRIYLFQQSNTVITQTSSGGRVALKTSDSNSLTTWTIILEYTKTTD